MPLFDTPKFPVTTENELILGWFDTMAVEDHDDLNDPIFYVLTDTLNFN